MKQKHLLRLKLLTQYMWMIKPFIIDKTTNPFIAKIEN